MTLLTIILLVIAFMAYAVKELQQFGKLNWFGFWGKVSWARKYKRILDTKQATIFVPAPNNWYYRLFKIRYKERFPLSATALVFLTDGFHLMQTIFFACLVAAMAINPMSAWTTAGVCYFVRWSTWFAAQKLLTK